MDNIRTLVSDSTLRAELPVQNGQEVAKFKVLFEQKFGLVISDDDASDLARRTIGLYYIKNYGVHLLCI